jgi:hypothetical protein
LLDAFAAFLEPVEAALHVLAGFLGDAGPDALGEVIRAQREIVHEPFERGIVGNQVFEIQFHNLVRTVIPA